MNRDAVISALAMSQIADRYTFRITWSEVDREFVGLCVEFPSLSWLAKSPEAALKGIRRAVTKAVQDMESNGEIPPAPLLKFNGAIRQ